MQQAKIDAQKIITVEGISDGKFKVGILRFENLNSCAFICQFTHKNL